MKNKLISDAMRELNRRSVKKMTKAQRVEKAKKAVRARKFRPVKLSPDEF